MKSRRMSRTKLKQLLKEVALVGELEATMNTMAPDEHDMIQLGKDMGRMKTNSEIIDEGLVPDPRQ